MHFSNCADPYDGIDSDMFSKYKHDIRELIDTAIAIPYEDFYTFSLQIADILHRRKLFVKS